MNHDEIVAAIQKLTYQISVLSEAIDYKEHPIEALILSNNWGESDIDKAHDIFERWDTKLNAGEKMNTYEFEADFKRDLGISYQGLKSIINAFYSDAKWTSVCEAYVDAFGDAPSLEYHSIKNRAR